MAPILWISILGILLCGAGFSKVVTASIVGGREDTSSEGNTEPSRLHTQFVPQVAFQCGFQGQYFTRDGKWASDVNSTDCLTAKLDILKFCQRVYPDLQVTNIVEASHHTKVADWCKPEGKPCKWRFWVKPYRCVVGEFESEALLVPEGCHFAHVDDTATCDGFQRWNRTARQQCAKQNKVVRSFSMLEPCGVDLFSGVEYVCCPREATTRAATTTTEPSIMHVEAKLEKDPKKKLVTSKVDQDDAAEDYSDSDEDEDDDDDDDDDDESMAEDAADRKKADKAQDGSGEDAYFRTADPDNEHQLYTEAMHRLETSHQQKVAKVMREWADVETRYEEMKRKDPNAAEPFRSQLIERLQKTVKALEEENLEEKRRLSEVHEQRVMAVMNDAKREAIKEYRDALEDEESHEILRTLQRYIKIEEKDRLHAINHYKHLLKADPETAKAYRTHVVKKLEDVDLRINGTIDMLRDAPSQAARIKPIILQFWQNYRRENTPSTIDDTLVWIGANKRGDDLLKAIEQQVEKEIKGEEIKDEDDIKEPLIGVESVLEQTENRLPRPEIVKPVNVEFDPEVMEDEHELPEVAAHAQRDDLHAERMVHESVNGETLDQPSYALMAFGVLSAALIVAAAVGFVAVRHHRKHRYMEVDSCTPEEKHVSAMQCSGYENPTYKHFDQP